MKDIYFDFSGRKYSGYILNDAAGKAEYCWFVFNDEEMIEKFGDAIAFHIRQQRLIPVYEHTSQASFIDLLKKKVEATLFPYQRNNTA